MDLRPTPANEPVAPVTFTGDELAAIAGALAAQGTKMSKAALSAARKVVAAEPQAVLQAAEPSAPTERLAKVVPLRPHQVTAPRFTVDDEIRDVLEQAVERRSPGTASDVAPIGLTGCYRRLFERDLLAHAPNLTRGSRKP